ncbi:tetratricopeptide repeat protein [Roseimaritima sediminicola]|uniref:tetratricopeptide repeat protein n=1 Tax=Roseimaritima sediminicola TaxID=2662066 RepID=UPI00129824EF|nr:tetratricopeptide repeat protein [Roseimaritima sediminicola]
MRLVSSLVLFCLLASLVLADTALGQADPDRRGALMAARYEQLLLRRPRPGAALERLFAHHRSAGTLDEKLQELTPETSPPPETPETSKTTPTADAAAGNRWLLKALLQQRSGDERGALESLRQAEPLLPTDPMASFLLGRALETDGQSEPAMAAYQRAIERRPAPVEAGPIYLALGRLYYENDQDDDADALWQNLQQQLGGAAAGLSQQVAQLMVQQQRFEQAIELYQHLAAEASGGDAIEWSLKAARLKLRSGQSQAAVESLQELLSRVRPGSWLANQIQHDIEAALRATGGEAAVIDYYAERWQADPDDVDLAVRLARAQLTSGRVEAAIETLRQILQRQPQASAAREVYLEALSAQQDWAAVAAEYAALVQQHPNRTEYLMRWGAAVLQDTKRPLEERRQQAAGLWQRYAQRHAEDPMAQLQVAQRLAAIEQTEAAEASFQAAIELAPEDPQYRELLGQFYHQRGRTKAALETWQSIAAPPHRSRATLLQWAGVLSNHGFTDESLAVWDEAAELDLTFAQRLQYTRELISAERFAEALEQWQAAERVAETDVERRQSWDVRVQLATLEGKRGELIRQTQAELDRVRGEAGPSQRTEAVNRLASLLESVGRRSEAVALLRAALQRQPHNAALLRSAADMLRRQDRIEDALELLRRLAEADPRQRVEVLKQMADLSVQVGRFEVARELGRELVQRQPENVSLWLKYAELCFQTGEPAGGYEALRQAVRVAPRDTAALEQLAERLAADYQTDEAIEVYWQQYDAASHAAEKTDVVAALAPLYDRQLRLPDLLERLAAMPQSQSSQAAQANSVIQQIAIAHEVTGNPAAALRVLEPVRRERPSDAGLLRRLIQLATLAGDHERLRTYYQALLRIEDDDSLRRDYLEHLAQRGRGGQVVDTLKAAVQNRSWQAARVALDVLLAQQQVETAVAALEDAATSDLHPDLRLRLAMLQLHQRQFDACRQTAAKIGAATSLEPPQETSIEWMLQVANMATVQNDEWLQVVSEMPSLTAEQTAAVAWPLEAIAAHRMQQTTAVIPSEEQRRQLHAADNDASPGSPARRRALWKAYAQILVHYHIEPPPTLSLRSTDHPETFALVCRLAQLGDSRGRTAALQVIENRQAALSAQYKGAADSTPWPLQDWQLAWLRDQLQQPPTGPYQDDPTRLVVAVANEHRAAGQTEVADRLLDPLLRPQQISAIPDAIFAALHSGRTAALGPQLARWRGWLRELSPDQVADTEDVVLVADRLPLLATAGDPQTGQQRFDILATLLAAGAAARQRQPQIDQRWDSPLERIAISTTASSSLRVSPVLGRSLSVAVIRLVLNLDREQSIALEQRLLNADADVPADEQSLRAVTAAALWQWNRDNDRPRSLLRLQEATERFPNNAEIRLACALQAERLQQPEQALQHFAKVQTEHPTLARTRDLGVVRVASYLDDVATARAAAERLQSMPLDSKVKKIVVGQLMRVGLEQQAGNFHASAPATTGRRSPYQSVPQLLGENRSEAAAEAAYEVLRSGTGAQARDAVEWLQDLKAIADVTGYLERRLEAKRLDPQLTEQLALLYAAAGDHAAAGDLRERQRQQMRAKIAGNRDAASQLQAAVDRSARRDFPSALEHFLNVFALDAARMEPHLDAFIQAAQNTRRTDEAFEQLAESDLSGLSYAALRELMDLDPRGVEQPTPPGRVFLVSLLNGAAEQQLGPLLRELSQSHRLGDQAAEAVASRLQKLFERSETFRSDAPLWTTGQPDSDGRFVGNLQPILTALEHAPEAAEQVRKRCLAMQNQPATSVVAGTVAALLSDDARAATERLNNLLSGVDPENAGVDPENAGVFLWQAAQALAQRPASKPTQVIGLFQLALEDPQLPESFRWTAGGIGGPLFAYLHAQERTDEARRWLLADFRDVRDSAPEAERASERLEAIHGRLQKIKLPVEAKLVRLALAIQRGEPVASDQRSASTTELDAEACLRVLESMLDPKTTGVQSLVRGFATLDQDPWQTSLATQAIDGLRHDPTGRATLETFNERLSQPASDSSAGRPEGDHADANARQMLRFLISTALDQPLDKDLLQQLTMIGPDAAAADRLEAWPLAGLALRQDAPEIRSGGVALASQLLPLAQQQGNWRLTLAIADNVLAVTGEQPPVMVIEVLGDMLQATRTDSASAAVRIERLNSAARVGSRHGLGDVTISAITESLVLWRNHRDLTTDPATQRANTDFAALSDALVSTAQLFETTSLKPAWTEAVVDLIAPPQQPEEVFLYLTPRVGRDRETQGTELRSPRSRLVPQSLVGVLIDALPPEIAASSLEPVLQREAFRPEAVQIVRTALVLQDPTSPPQALQREIERLFAVADIQPPAWDTMVAQVEQRRPWIKTIQGMRRVEQTCRQADRYLVALDAAADSVREQPAVREVVDRARLRVAAMLLVDSGAFERAATDVAAMLSELRESPVEAVRERAKQLQQSR